MLKYIRFIKLEHTLFSLPIVFTGTFLALKGTGQPFPYMKAFWIFLAVAGARSAGFGLNRVLDAELDAQNPRTRHREIPSGQISKKAAWVFIAVSSALFIFSAGMLSKTCLILAPIPLILFFIYPFMKRRTLWTHLGLGLAWGTGPMGGWLAVRPEIFPIADLLPAILLTIFCVFWVAGFDIIYALLDEGFDREHGIFSMPALLGKTTALRISEVFHAAGFLSLGLLVSQFMDSPWKFPLLAVAGTLFIVSHWKMQFDEFSPALVDLAFFKMNAALGFTIFVLAVMG